jgi:hypothetical protein
MRQCGLSTISIKSDTMANLPARTAERRLIYTGQADKKSVFVIIAITHFRRFQTLFSRNHRQICGNGFTRYIWF